MLNKTFKIKYSQMVISVTLSMVLDIKHLENLLLHTIHSLSKNNFSKCPNL